MMDHDDAVAAAHRLCRQTDVGYVHLAPAHRPVRPVRRECEAPIQLASDALDTNARLADDLHLCGMAGGAQHLAVRGPVTGTLVRGDGQCRMDRRRSDRPDRSSMGTRIFSRSTSTPVLI